MTINKRFSELLKRLNISTEEACELLGMSKPYLNKLKTEGQSFGVEPLKQILIGIPSVNPRWLILEEGEMFLENPASKVCKESGNVVREEQAAYENSKLVDVVTLQAKHIDHMTNLANDLMKANKLKDVLIADLRKGMDSLNERLRVKEAIIYGKDTVIRSLGGEVREPSDHESAGVEQGEAV